MKLDESTMLPTNTEAVAVFDDSVTMQAAIDELQSSGFDRAELSLLASEQAVQEKLGHRYEKVEELEDDSAVPRTAYVSIESIGDAEGGLIGALMYVGGGIGSGAIVASGGTLVAMIGGAAMAGGIGAAVGAVLAAWVGEQHADRIQEQLRHGGLLLWVRTRDDAHEKKAHDILSKHSAHDVHIHSLP